MCTTCGCGTAHVHVDTGDKEHQHEHEHMHTHEHPHSHEHEHVHTHVHPHSHEHKGMQSYGSPTIIHHHYHKDVIHYHITQPDFNKAVQTNIAEVPQLAKAVTTDEVGSTTDKRLIELEANVLAKNNSFAQQNRHHFEQQHILTLNLVSSPGSGKTTLLVETLKKLSAKTPCVVIEGDQQTSNDAKRIRDTGVKAVQINTGKGCHLDAEMVKKAYTQLNLEDNSLLLIENVGNLVCPADFDLGERHKVVLLSVTEGEDKPVKYPHMFAASDLMVINKIDLLPYIDFDVEKCINYAKSINSKIQVIKLSATTGEGLDAWLTWLEQELCA